MTDVLRTARITFLPAGTMDTASSRLRCYGLARELARIGYPTQIGYRREDTIDILFVQKRINEEILALTRSVKKSGGLVIYDIDDYGDGLAWLQVSAEVHAEFISLCDVLCVDTDVRLEVFAKDEKYASISRKWVIVDPIDYVGLPGTENIPRSARQGKLIGIWFGNAPNIAPAVPYLDAASRCPNVSHLEIISNKEFVGKLTEMFPHYRIEAWQLDTFPRRLRDSDFCLLIHDAGLEGVQKSNNKMLAALALGVVPFLSRTPAYESTAKAMGLEELLLDRPEDLPGKLTTENLTTIRAAIAASQCQSELARFLPERVARDFSERIQELLMPIPISGFRKLTIVTHYYNNEACLKGQLDTWRTYPREILDQLEFILIDDFSDIPSSPDLTNLPARLLRIDTDIDWNQAGCRNLGISQIRTKWALIYDVDHIISRDHLMRLLAGLETLEQDCLYLFGRRENGELINSHINSFLTSRAALLNSGGYDEDFRGHYGFEDVYFLECWRRGGRKIVQLTNVELWVNGLGTAKLDRDQTRNRTLMQEKLAAGVPGPSSTVRFRWHLAAESGTAAAPTPAAATPIKLNLGSGEQPLPGYINVDLASERRGRQPDVLCDIRDLHSVFADNHADEILAVHVVEHMWRWEVVDVLKEWVRVLKPGGTLILECPNLISACQELLKDPLIGARSDQSKTMWCLYGDPSWKDPLMCHRWLYTPHSLAEVMYEAGLRDLRQESALFKAREPRDMRIVGNKPAA